MISASSDARIARLQGAAESERKWSTRQTRGRAAGATRFHSGEEKDMPTFVMLTNLTSEGVQTLKNNPSRIQEVNKEVEQLGVTVKEQWATLGQYDFITIVEAPDEKTMAKVSVELGSRGTMSSQTLAAIPAEDFASAL
jgi:uncharacterized protein with GYD domain